MTWKSSSGGSLGRSTISSSCKVIGEVGVYMISVEEEECSLAAICDGAACLLDKGTESVSALFDGPVPLPYPHVWWHVTFTPISR